MKRSPIVLWLLLITFTAAMIEAISAVFLFHQDSIAGRDMPDYHYSEGHFATAVIVHKVLARLGPPPDPPLPNSVASTPSPFFKPDDTLGYRIDPGTYEVVFERPSDGHRYRWWVTMEPNGARSTGFHGAEAPRRVFIFGDSILFGWGLSDPHVFAWLLQREFEPHHVFNFAAGGYGTVHALHEIRALGAEVRADDIVILGYADYYNERNVAAPHRVREVYRYVQRGATLAAHAYAHPFARLNGDAIETGLLNGDCAKNDGWCEKPDPSLEEMARVTSALIREIAKATPAHVAVAVTRATDDDPVLSALRADGIPIIDLRPSQAYYEKDDIAGGFDGHPGPIAHHMYYRKTAAYLRSLGLGAAPAPGGS